MEYRWNDFAAPSLASWGWRPSKAVVLPKIESIRLGGSSRHKLRNEAVAKRELWRAKILRPVLIFFDRSFGRRMPKARDPGCNMF